MFPSSTYFFPSCFRRARAPSVPKANPPSTKTTPTTSSTAAPEASPIQTDLAPEHTAADTSPTPSSRGKGVADDNPNRQVAGSSSLLEGIDLSDID